MKKYDIFLVDADNTVLDFHASSRAALKAAFESFGKAWTEEYAKKFSVFNDSHWERLERKELTREKLLGERFPLFLKMLGMEDVSGESFNEKYIGYLATHPVYMEGAENFLKELNGAGRVYIVTNGTYSVQKSRFDIARLWDYAEEAFVSEKIGFDKPNKAYTDYVVSHIPDFDKSRAVWIGDSLTADIRAANAADIVSIWLNPGGKAADGKAFPDYEARSYTEILEILQIY